MAECATGASASNRACRKWISCQSCHCTLLGCKPFSNQGPGEPGLKGLLHSWWEGSKSWADPEEWGPGKDFPVHCTRRRPSRQEHMQDKEGAASCLFRTAWSISAQHLQANLGCLLPWALMFAIVSRLTVCRLLANCGILSKLSTYATSCPHHVLPQTMQLSPRQWPLEHLD